MTINRPLSGNVTDLIWAWTIRTIRARYQQSILGWLWAILQPAASVAIFSFVFTRFVQIDTGGIPYPVFSYVAVLPWTFLASALQDMTISLVSNITLVTKIYFPRETLPIAAMLARLLDFCVASVLLVILIFLYQVPLFLLALFFIPLILTIQIALIVGLGLFTTALNVFSRDVTPLLTLIISLWFYASPIIYPVTMVPSHLRSVYLLNPMASILEAYRSVLLYGQIPDKTLITAGVISFIVLIFGYAFFKRVEHLFADIV
jgi:lipopolysaccharide transport system permease protein